MPAEIVGVVGDVRSRKVAEPDDMELYRPWAQENFPFLTHRCAQRFESGRGDEIGAIRAEHSRSRSGDRVAAIDERESSRKRSVRRG